MVMAYACSKDAQAGDGLDGQSTFTRELGVPFSNKMVLPWPGSLAWHLLVASLRNLALCTQRSVDQLDA
jgi:hypothetical protein